MRARYTRDGVKAIMEMINQGASFEKISKATGIKVMITVKNWLDNYYTVKKALRDKFYDQLKKNNSIAREKEAVNELEMNKVEMNEVEMNEVETEKCEMTEEDIAWEKEFWVPEVDFLIDAVRLTLTEISPILAFMKANKKTYVFATMKEVNLQAVCLGGPTVITNNRKVMSYCDWDGIPTMSADDFKGFVYESYDLKWAKEIELPGYYKRRNGGVSCWVQTSAQKFSKKHGFDEYASIFVENHEVYRNFSMKPGNRVEYRIESNDGKMYSWIFELMDNALFKEVSYTERPLDFIIKEELVA